MRGGCETERDGRCRATEGVPRMGRAPCTQIIDPRSTHDPNNFAANRAVRMNSRAQALVNSYSARYAVHQHSTRHEQVTCILQGGAFP